MPIKPLKRLSLWTLCVLPLLLGGCQSLPSDDTTHAVPAKQTLEQAMTAQFKKNFSYKTFAKLLPSTRLELDAQSACNIAHDERYVALAKSAEKDGLDLSADQYLDDKDDLKQAYLACIDDHNHVWRSIDDIKDGATYTAQKRYLTDPVSLTITGNYRPLLGQMSALPRAEYRLGAVEMMVNQPVMVDWQAGKLYVWADNFALANATLLDKTLGDKWRHKWLSFPLNDGSLPNDFVKTFAQTYLNTQKQRLLDGDFDYVPATKVLGALPDGVIDNGAFDKARILATPVIIQAKLAPQHTQWTAFVEAMGERYPRLVQTHADDGDSPANNTHNNDAYNNDDKANAQQSDDGDDKTIDKENENHSQSAKPLTSEHLIKSLLRSLQQRATQETDVQETDVQETDVQETDVLMFYGLDGNRLLWVINATPRAVKGFDVRTMTVFDDGLIDVFDRLPKAHQKPTAQNSIDGLAYLNERKPSDLTMLGRIFGLDDLAGEAVEHSSTD